MIIDKALLDSVSKQAKESPRLRMNYNLHEKLTDSTHRFFNAMEPGTVVPIHRHQNCAETFILVRGSMRVVLYDDDRNVVEDTILSAGGDNYGIHIPTGVWHWVDILESGTVTFEVKEGPYEALKEEDIMK